MIRSLATLVIAPVALLAAARPAQALSCAASYVRVISPTEQGAPLNARVLIEVYARHGQKVELDAILLRAKGSNLPIAAARKLTGSGEVRVLELVPAAPLRPKTEYEVTQGRGTTLSVAGRFTTGDATDRSPPAALKALTVRFYDAEVSNVWWGPGKRRHRWLVVDAAREASDRALPFAYWIGEGKAIDFGKPPTGYVIDFGQPASLGQVPSSCQVTNLALPGPGKAGRLRFGVRVVDAAGNLGPAREAEVDLRKPEKQR